MSIPSSSSGESNSLDETSTSTDAGHSDGDATSDVNSTPTLDGSSFTTEDASSSSTWSQTSDSSTTSSTTPTTSETPSTSSTSSTSSETTTSAEETSETLTTTTDACVEAMCFSVNHNRAYNNAIYATGGNLAFRLNGDGYAHSIVAIEILSGEVSGESRLAVRSNSGGLPGSLLGSASFHISPSNNWKRATFDSPVDLPSTGDFWVDWTSINGAQAPIAVNGDGVLQAYRANDASSWSLVDSRLAMIRVWCCDP